MAAAEGEAQRAAEEASEWRTAQSQFDAAAEIIGLEPELREILREVQREFTCHFPVHLDNGEVEVYTLEEQCNGSATIEMKPGTQPGDVLVRRGQGIPRISGGGRGDHVIQFKVEIPKKLSQRQEELLRELATDLGEGVRAEKRGLFSRKK